MAKKAKKAKEPSDWWVVPLGIGGILLGVHLLSSQDTKKEKEPAGDVAPPDEEVPPEVQEQAAKQPDAPPVPQGTPIRLKNPNIPISKQRKDAARRAEEATRYDHNYRDFGKFKYGEKPDISVVPSADNPLVADCSGFASWVLGKYLSGIPHGTVNQINIGRKVSREVAKKTPGILAFDRDTEPPYSHVAVTLGLAGAHDPKEDTGIIAEAYNQKKGIITNPLRESFDVFVDPWAVAVGQPAAGSGDLGSDPTYGGGSDLTSSTPSQEDIESKISFGKPTEEEMARNLLNQYGGGVFGWPVRQKARVRGRLLVPSQRKV